MVVRTTIARVLRSKSSLDSSGSYYESAFWMLTAMSVVNECNKIFDEARNLDFL
jgi:hypothetical protein